MTENRAGALATGIDVLPPFWRRLLHRWLIEYNPLYLISALLVFGGVMLLSDGIGPSESLTGGIVYSGIIEVYALALIAGAALLMRRGLRRPAVMLGLLVVLYQGDLTLTTETYAYYGAAGLLTVVAWFALFIAKLLAVARALRLAPSWSALAIPVFGASGLVVLPRLLGTGAVADPEALVALWLFALFAAGLFTLRPVASRVPLDAWGETVLRRGLSASWWLWAGLTLGHVAFWASKYELDLTILVPMALLLGTRWLHTERSLWAGVLGVVAFVGLSLPAGAFATTALMAAVTLSLHALRKPTLRSEPTSAKQAPGPYRSADGTPESVPAASVFCFAPAARVARLRLLTGSVTGVYLWAWTLDWSGGAWPEHRFALDLAFATLLLFVVWRTRSRFAALPAVASAIHAAVAARLITAPESAWGWGALSVALGFALLAGSVAASLWLQRHEALAEALGGADEEGASDPLTRARDV